MAIFAKSLGVVASLAFAALPAPTFAQESPSWTVSKTADECVLTRRVDGPAPGVLMVRSPPGSDRYTFVVATENLPQPRDPFTAIDIIFDGIGKTIKAEGQPGNVGAGLQAIQFNVIDWIDFAFIAKASAVRLQYDGQIFGPFALPDMADAMSALRDCLGAALRLSGADAAQFAPGGSPPEPLKPRMEFLSFDQLRRLTLAGSNKYNRIYRLTIDGSGRIAECARTTRPRGDRVEKTLCGMLAEQTLFTPAHDQAGKPVNGIAIFWMPVILRRIGSSELKLMP